MEKHPLISFIVPLFNAEEYVENCLNSLLNQGIDENDYEILVINDGSTDSSSLKVEAISKNNECIRLINKENGGVSSARNIGIKLSRGEYLCFVDADDYIVENGISNLMKQLNGIILPDIIKFSSITVDSYFKELNILDYGYNKVCTIDEFIKKKGYGTFVWGQLIRRSLIIDKGIEFENYVVSEDTLFSIILYSKNANNTIIESHANIYRYVVRPKSAVNNYTYSHLEKQLNGNLSIVERVKYLKKEHPKYHQQMDKLINGFRRTSFTRLLAIDWNWTQVSEYTQKAYLVNLFPMQRDSKFDKLANFILAHKLVFLLTGFLYRKLFLPYVSKYVKRN